MFFACPDPRGVAPGYHISPLRGFSSRLSVTRTIQASLPRDVASLEQNERDAGAELVGARLDVVGGENRAELSGLILFRVVALAAYHHERGLRVVVGGDVAEVADVRVVAEVPGQRPVFGRGDVDARLLRA